MSTTIIATESLVIHQLENPDGTRALQFVAQGDHQHASPDDPASLAYLLVMTLIGLTQSGVTFQALQQNFGVDVNTEAPTAIVENGA